MDGDELFQNTRESVEKTTRSQGFPADYSTSTDVTRKVLEWMNEGNDVNDFLKKNVVWDELKPAFETAIQSLKNIRESSSLYKADLPDEMIDRMLDWDAPLSEQPAAVRDVLMPLVTAALAKQGTPKHLLEHYANRQLGGDLVKDVLVGNGRGRKDVSELLRQAGIPGIKYLDAGSRGQSGTGTRNFVVFPGEEKKVKILERK